MKVSKLLFLVVLFAFFAACSKEDDTKEPEFVQEYSFTIDGTNYTFTDFKVDTTYLQDDNRVFISKKDGDNTFNLNFPLDLAIGLHGMDWNDGGVFFFMRIPKGDFFTLDNEMSVINVTSIDTKNRTISATFKGIGAQGLGTKTTVITNGVLKARY